MICFLAVVKITAFMNRAIRGLPLALIFKIQVEKG
jgi:hypothetical protein